MSKPDITGCKAALLSNVNMNFVIRMLQKSVTVYEAEGYGNELGILMNPGSSYHAFGADYTFLVIELMELIEHELEPQAAGAKMEAWFATLNNAISTEGIYYISDAYLWGVELAAVFDCGRKQALQMRWQELLEDFCRNHKNVRILPYRHLVESMGEEAAFSMKMWYMGKILLSNQAQQGLCDLILDRICREVRTPKKVLLLDLDNTLWGGLAGEADHTPVKLSEDHGGLAFKNLQRVILQMQKQGVLLGIVSKNNEADALEIIEKHPHMVLRRSCFAAEKINWKPKHENIKEIAAQLNLGTDSFVFWDDNPAERQLVKELLPEVAVPDFPLRPEELAPAMVAIYEQYFAGSTLTAEDLDKTNQYAANAKRSLLAENAGSFEDYLKQLAIVMKRVDPVENVDRLTQLMNKTNQFNLTTMRYQPSRVQELLADNKKQIYLYSVADRFGDNGIVAAAIVDVSGIPVIEEFVMSCRVMGRNIEYAVMDDIETKLRQAGFTALRGRYIPTAKNKPVEKLYDQLGYHRVAKLPEGGVEGVESVESVESVEYEISLQDTPARCYFVEWR